MEKRRAHYNLATVIAVVMDRRAAAFTKSAIDGGRAMGLTVSEMIDVICALKSGHLYKSMTTYKDNTVWQDVYHANTPVGKAYVKSHAEGGWRTRHPIQGVVAMARICVCCDAKSEMTPFFDETHLVSFRDLKAEVGGLSGFRCGSCGEIEYDQPSAERYAQAGDALVLQDRQAVGEDLRRIRKKLRINQTEASALTGGGHNAFSRYETGKVSPPPAVVNLFRMLDRHPDDIKELRRA